jgi:ABC-type polysaccharide/polyol phosphate transport system ATPase subunit
MNEAVIKVRNVSKAYRIWHSPAARLKSIALHTAKHLVPPLWNGCTKAQARCFRDFYAVRDISLDICRGEAVGIIGRNGSGKSTLLQIIAGTLTPTSGSIEINGRVAALLELGSGFNPEFTGRENVLVNASILGLNVAQVRERFSSIEAFADIGDFIDQPVKVYSSGMVMRLAFAVCAHVDADVLIIDEALGVGDARFQLKCARTIDRFLAENRTLLFVSHDASMVKRLCQRAILLHQGREVYLGVPNDVVNLYSKLTADGGSPESIAADIATLTTNSIGQPSATPLMQATPARMEKGKPVLEQQSEEFDHPRLIDKIRALEIALAEHPRRNEVDKKMRALLSEESRPKENSAQEFSYGGDLGRILEIDVLDGRECPRIWFETGEPIVVRMLVESFGDFHDPIFALTIKSLSGVEIYGTNTFASNQPSGPITRGERREARFRFNLNLMAGHYFLSFGFTHFVGDELLILHRRYDAIKIEIHGRDRTFGIANLNALIETRPASVAERIQS